MKKFIIILLSIFAALVLFLFVVYMVATKAIQNNADNEKNAAAEKQISDNTFKNPNGTEIPTVQGTSTTTGTVFVNGSTTVSTTTEDLPTIPSSIVYENAAQNNDNIVLSVDSVGEGSDGTVVVSFRVITSNALQPASLDPAELIKITTAEGNDTQARIIEGNFSNMAPGQILNGRVVFFLPQKRNALIIQVGKDDRAMFYEFDFTKNTYKQADTG